MPTIRIHSRQEDGEVVTYTPTGGGDFRDPTDFVAYLMAQEQGETVTIGCVIAEYVRGEESSSPCQSCGEDVPETEAHGDPDTEYLCPTCPGKGGTMLKEYVVLNIEPDMEIVALPAHWVADGVRNDDAWPVLSSRDEAVAFEDYDHCAVVLDSETPASLRGFSDSVRPAYARYLISIIHTLHDEGILNDEGVYQLCTDEGVAGALEGEVTS